MLSYKKDWEVGRRTLLLGSKPCHKFRLHGTGDSKGVGTKVVEDALMHGNKNPNLIPEPSWIFPVKILQDPKSLGSYPDLYKILQISCAILLIGTRQEINRFGQDSRRFLNIS